MEIVQVVNHFYPCKGGKESIVIELSEWLKRKGHSVGVVCLDKCADSPKKLAPYSEWHGIKVRRLPFLNLRFLKVGVPMPRLFKKAEVVHVHGLCWLADFLALTKVFYRKPLVLSTHGGIFHTKAISGLKKIYFFGWLRLIGRAFDKVIAVSENDFELFSKIFPKEKIVLVENAIEVERFKGSRGKRKPNSFLFVGRLSRNKRVELLIGAFAKIAGKKGALLTVVGKDFDGVLPELKSKAKDLGVEGKVKFEGAVGEEKLLQLFGSHTFFASASEYEGFGVSAIEAMAAGLVPLLNGIPSFRGFIERGKAGYVVDFKDSEKAGKALEKACGLRENELQKLSENGKSFARGFSWQSKVKEFEKVYNQLTF